MGGDPITTSLGYLGDGRPGTALLSIPIISFYFAVQRSFVQGVTAGAVK